MGLRGRYDRPFWEDIIDAPEDEAGRARMIREAINGQIEIVRQQRPNPPPEFILNSWMEGSGLLRGGTLELPPGVVRVWADNGRGMIEDGGKIAAGDGVYYHTGVIGRNGNNLSERVPVDRIARELGRAVKAGATRYLMLNPSNIRPHAMTTRAVMELAWDARPWTASPADASEEFLVRWSREEFGAEAAPAVVRYYKAYFDAPARYASPEAETISDVFEQWCARELLLRIIHNDETSPIRYDYLRRQGHEGLRRASGRDLPPGRTALAAGLPVGRASAGARAGRAARFFRPTCSRRSGCTCTPTGCCWRLPKRPRRSCKPRRNSASSTARWYPFARSRRTCARPSTASGPVSTRWATGSSTSR